MKNATRVLSLIILLFLLAGCAGENLPEQTIDETQKYNQPEVTIDEVLKYDETGYYISEIQWLNNEDIFLKIVQSKKAGENNDLPINKLFAVNIKTNKGALLFEGHENDFHMDGNTLILCDNNKMYAYNAEYCLEFVNLKLEKSYNLKEKFNEVFGENTYVATSLNINKEGICSLIYNGDIVTFPLDDVENHEILIKRTSELVNADKLNELINAGQLDDCKEVPATYYYLPLWSPDGKWMLYNERETLEGHDSKVIMYNIADKKEKSFNFKYMDCYRWGEISNYVIGCTWPTYAPKPEIRVYNLNNDKCKSFVLDEAINSISFRSINVLDTAGSKILLSCFKAGGRPLLMLDFITGEIEWVTEPNSRVLNAVISPQKDKILCYSINSNISNLEVINID